jgi:apyrase
MAASPKKTAAKKHHKLQIDGVKMRYESWVKGRNVYSMCLLCMLGALLPIMTGVLVLPSYAIPEWWRGDDTAMSIDDVSSLFDVAVHSLELSLEELEDQTKYVIVIDCGSSGSRLHAYTFTTGSVGIQLKDELFLRIKKPLGDFATVPKDGAATLRPLLEAAMEYVPASVHAKTPMMIGATAGLRMLPGSQAQDLLDAVAEITSTMTSFKLDPKVDIMLMGGSAEGAYAWLAVNFLQERIGRRNRLVDRGQARISVLDLGGGSVQIVRTLGTGLHSVRATGHEVLVGQEQAARVFVHSFLGLGLLASRMAVIKSGLSSLCIPLGAESYFTFGGETTFYGGLRVRKFYPSIKECIKIVRREFRKHYQKCEKNRYADVEMPHTNWVMHSDCRYFPGAARADADPNDEYYLMSFFNDRVMHAGAAFFLDGEYRSTPRLMREAADLHCTDRVLRRDDDDDNFLCMDMLFISELLVEGFKMSEDQVVTVFESRKNGNKTFQASWSLGAAVHLIFHDSQSEALSIQRENNMIGESDEGQSDQLMDITTGG